MLVTSNRRHHCRRASISAGFRRTSSSRLSDSQLFSGWPCSGPGEQWHWSKLGKTGMAAGDRGGMGRRMEGWMAEKWWQKKQTLTQNHSHARARSALPHVQVTECPFLAPPAPRSCKVVEIHPDFWLCKGQPFQSLAVLSIRLAPTLDQNTLHISSSVPH